MTTASALTNGARHRGPAAGQRLPLVIERAGLGDVRSSLVELPRAPSTPALLDRIAAVLRLRLPVRRLALTPIIDEVLDEPQTDEPWSVTLYDEVAAVELVTLPLALAGLAVGMLEVELVDADAFVIDDLVTLGPVLAGVLAARRPLTLSSLPPVSSRGFATPPGALSVDLQPTGRPRGAVGLGARLQLTLPDGSGVRELGDTLGDPALVAAVEQWLLAAAVHHLASTVRPRWLVVSLQPSTLLDPELWRLLGRAPMRVVVELVTPEQAAAFDHVAPRLSARNLPWVQRVAA